MSMPTREELLRYFPPTDDPERRERRRHIARVLVETEPEVRDELVEQGLGYLFERRLGRPLSTDEHCTLHARLRSLGSGRLTDVALELSSEALAAWLADPSAR